MTLEEALGEAVAGARVTAPHLQPGCYVEHSFSRGFLRCWPVDRPDEEPSRTQCDFRQHAGDEAATWRILEPAEQYPPVVKNAWGQPTKADPMAGCGPAVSEPWTTEFCGVCDFTKDKCKCDPEPKPAASGWGNPLLKKETNKWGK